MKSNFDIVIIGGGAIGTSMFRDATMRGFSACLVEANSVGGKTTASSHQNLLGGMRYAVTDPTVAAECATENRTMSKIAPSIVSDRLNVFVGSDEEYAENAMRNAKRIGVYYKQIPREDISREIPDLSGNLTVFLETADRNIDSTRLCTLNCDAGIIHGGVLREHCRVLSIKSCSDGFALKCGDHDELDCRFAINASGPWIEEIAAMIGGRIRATYRQGTICVLQSRSPYGLQRLHHPSDGDAYIVHGEYAWLGTTSYLLQLPSEARVLDGDVEYLKRNFSNVLPQIIDDVPITSFVGVRTFVAGSHPGLIADGRDLSRGISLVESFPNLLSVAGGKLTTARLAAERIMNLISSRLGSKKGSSTSETRLDE